MYGVGAPIGIQLLEQAGHMGLHGVRRDVQAHRNFFVGSTDGQLAQHFQLTTADSKRPRSGIRTTNCRLQSRVGWPGGFENLPVLRGKGER